MFQQFQTLNYAGFWLRFAAYMIDAILITMVTCPLGAVIGAMSALAEQGAASGGMSVAMTVVVYVISFGVTWLYYALLESSSWQGTLGKKLLNIRLTDLDGDRISFGRATGRYLGKMLSGVLFFVVVIFASAIDDNPLLLIFGMLLAFLVSLMAYAMAAFTEKKQALHDIVAGTLVLQGAPADAGGVTLNQPPPPPPSDYGQGGGYGGAGGSGGEYGGSYGGGYGS